MKIIFLSMPPPQKKWQEHLHIHKMFVKVLKYKIDWENGSELPSQNVGKLSLHTLGEYQTCWHPTLLPARHYFVRCSPLNIFPLLALIPFLFWTIESAWLPNREPKKKIKTEQVFNEDYHKPLIKDFTKTLCDDCIEDCNSYYY